MQNFPENYFSAIGVDIKKEFQELVKDYLSKRGRIGQLFLEHYRDNKSLEELSEKYPKICKDLRKGGVSIDTVAKRNYDADVNHICGYKEAQEKAQEKITKLKEYCYVSSDKIRKYEEELSDMRAELEEKTYRIMALENSLRDFEEQDRLQKEQEKLLEEESRILKVGQIYGCKMTKNLFNKRIEDVEMDKRGKNVLMRHNLKTIGAALEYIQGDFTKLLGFMTVGPKTVERIKEAIKKQIEGDDA